MEEVSDMWREQSRDDQVFFFQTWRKKPAECLKKVKVFVAHDGECHEFTDENEQMIVHSVPELECNHEEADTRLFLHCLYAARHQPSSSTDRAPYPALIKSPDTDVFVIGITMAEHIGAEVLFHTGRGNNTKTLSISKISSHLGPHVSKALISLHCFTGCDSVSSFHGKYKPEAFKLFASDTACHAVFQELGSSVIDEYW